MHPTGIHHSGCPRPARLLLLALVPMLVFCRVGLAQNGRGSLPKSDGEAAEAVTPIRVGLVVSGGVSLGSYQGGLGWGLVELMRRSEDSAFRSHVRVCRSRPIRACVDSSDVGWRHLPHMELAEAVGASAGNINALLAAIEWCRAPGLRSAPEESLFWAMWTHTGWQQLFPLDTGSAFKAALFHREYFDSLLTRVNRTLANGYKRTGCDVPLGIVATRLAADSVQLKQDSPIWAVTQRFVSIFRLSWDASPEALRFRQLLAARARGDTSYARCLMDGLGHPCYVNEATVTALGKVLMLRPAGASNVLRNADVYDLVQASGAFPFAFAPVRLTYWDAKDVIEKNCASSVDGCPPHSEDFVDGGVFDNNPLDLALNLYRTTTPPDTTRRAHIIYISPATLRGDLRAARQTAAQRDTTSSRGLAALQLLALQGLSAATQYELQSAVRHLATDSSARTWIHTTSRAEPIVGEHLQHFAAFFGRPFREFDFYAGVYDAFDYVARDVMCDHETVDVERCVSEAMATLIAREADSSLGPIAPDVLARLYAAEHRDSLRLPSAMPLTNPQDANQHALVLSVWKALRSHPGLSPSPGCAERYGAWRLLCADGFDAVVTAFADDKAAAHLVARAARRPECRPEQWRTAPDDRDCVADVTLLNLMQHPQRFADRLADDLLQQVWRVETQMASEGYSGHAGVADLARFAFLSLAGSPTAEGRHSRSSVPSRPHHGFVAWYRNTTPYFISLNVDAGGGEIGYLPTHFFSDRWSIGAPITPFNWRPRQGKGISSEAFSALGLMPRWRLGSPIFSAVEAGPEVLASWYDWKPRCGLRTTSISGAVYLLGEKVRVGARWLPRTSEPLIRNRHATYGLGIADVNGIIFWIIHSKFH